MNNTTENKQQKKFISEFGQIEGHLDPDDLAQDPLTIQKYELKRIENVIGPEDTCVVLYFGDYSHLALSESQINALKAWLLQEKGKGND